MVRAVSSNVAPPRLLFGLPLDAGVDASKPPPCWTDATKIREEPEKMKSILKTLFAALTFVTNLPAQDFLPEIKAPFYRVRYEGSQQPGELIYGVSYTAWLPPNVGSLRGVIVHQHGCGEGACKGGQTAAFDLHWQALAAKHSCALIGPSYEQPEGADCGMWCDPRNGSEARFLQALHDLGEQTKHPEIATVPWALWGHSGGGVWVGTMLVLHPNRVAAVWLRSGTPRMKAEPTSNLPSMEFPEAALEVPVMCNLGTQEGVTVTDGRFAGVWQKNESFFTDVRARGGLIGIAVDPNSSHDCGNSRYLAIPWFDTCLAARLPETDSGKLRSMPKQDAWLAPLLNADALPMTSFAGDVKSSAWLPNQRIAAAYSDYITDGNVTDGSPPPTPTHVQLIDNKLTWNAVADLESGIAEFLIERDGVEVARVPDMPSKSIGRPVFQKTSYHDTPTPPLLKMEFDVEQSSLQAKPVYTVRSVNSVGLKSDASKAPTSASKN